MKLTKLASTTSLAAALLAGSNAFAVPIAVVPTFTAGTTLNTSALSTFTTSGAAMAGMSVTAYFGAATETVIWAPTVGDGGAAAGTNWTLSFDFDTTFSPNQWALVTTSGLAASMTRLVIDGQPGDVIFDTIIDPETSPGSARGWPFSDVDGPAGLSMTAAYTNQVAIANTVYGDLFTVLDLGFGGTNSGLGADSRVLFTADTDETLLDDDLTPIPLPGTVTLLGFGLACIGLVRRHRKTT